MAFERVWMVRAVDALIQTSGAVTLSVFSDLPGNQMAPRESRVMDTSAIIGRRTYRFRLKGTTKGKIFRWQLSGSAVVYLFGLRVYARALGDGGDWSWYTIPVEPTPEAWTEIKLPIDESPEGWSEARIPLRATADEREWVEIPVGA